jgi:hypothetical protein
MLNIKEIAPKLTQKLSIAINDDEAVEFAEALIAELAKQNESCAFLHEWIEYHPFGDTFAGEPCATITNDEKPFDSSDTVSPLFTFPPTAEQIEQETAEAIAKFVAFQRNDIPATGIEFAEVIRNGAWKEFKK